MSSHSIPNRNSGTNPTSRNGVTPGSPASASVNHPNSPQPPAPPCPLAGEPMTNLQRRLVCKQIALDPTRKGTERIAAIKLDLKLAEAEAETESERKAAATATEKLSPEERERARTIPDPTRRPGPTQGGCAPNPVAAPPFSTPGGHSHVSPGPAQAATSQPAGTPPHPAGKPAAHNTAPGAAHCHPGPARR